jgi:hypothetical protein
MTLSGNFWIHPCIRLPDFSAGTSIPNFIKMQRKHTRTQAPHYAFILSSMCKDCIVDSAKHRTQTSWHTGWTTGVRFPASEGREFFSSPPHPDQLWDPPSILSSGYRGYLSLAVVRPESDTDHSPPSSVWIYTSTPQCAFMLWYLIKQITSSWRGSWLNLTYCTY